MVTVSVVTAGSGDTYRVERVYLDRDHAYTFAHDYNASAPVEPVQVEEWETGAPPGADDGPYWWARVPVSKRRAELRHTRDGEPRDDFEIRQEWVDRRRPARGRGGATRTGRNTQSRGGGAVEGEGGGTFWETIT
jgi:hypothetical protein